MRHCKILLLLALLATTSAGCASATRRGDGLASIRAKPAAEPAAPPQRLVVSARPGPSPAADPAKADDHAGIFARPDGLAKFFPGLQKDPSATPKVARTAERTTWLGRRLRGLGQGTPTSLTYSTAPRPGVAGRASEPGDVSILPVSLTLPAEHPRDHRVTPTAGEADSQPGPDDRDKSRPAPAPDIEALAPLAPANPESFSAPAVPSPEPAPTPAQPAGPIPTPAPSSEAPTPAAEPTPAPADPSPRAEPMPEPTVPEARSDSPPALPEPSIPEAKAPEVKEPEPKASEAAPKPSAEPAVVSPEPPVVDSSTPPAPTPAEPAVPTPNPAATILPTTDPRERPRLAPPRARTNPAPVVPPRPKKADPAPAPTPIPTRASVPSKSIPLAAKEKGKDSSPKAVAGKPKVQDRAVLAAKAQVEASHALGLPDPTLPASYYRNDAPPVRADSAVVATTTAPTDPGVARVAGPCPHCGHDPSWRPSLQRLGRRVLGLGEFAPTHP